MGFAIRHRQEIKKQTFIKRGEEYTRKGYDVKVHTAEKFRLKCCKVGLSETQCVEMMIEHFCHVTGWGDSVRQAPFFEQRAQEHIKQAVGYVVKDLFPWMK